MADLVPGAELELRAEPLLASIGAAVVGSGCFAGEFDCVDPGALLASGDAAGGLAFRQIGGTHLAHSNSEADLGCGAGAVLFFERSRLFVVERGDAVARDDRVLLRASRFLAAAECVARTRGG